jgi:hypothetical protein
MGDSVFLIAVTSFAVTKARGVGPPKIHAAVVVRPLPRRHLPAAGCVSRSRQQCQSNVASEQQTAQDLAAARRWLQLVSNSCGVHSWCLKVGALFGASL